MSTGTLLDRARCKLPLMAKRELVGIQELRLNLAAHIKTAEEEGTHAVVQRRTERVAVLVDMDWYRRASEALGEPTEF